MEPYTLRLAEPGDAPVLVELFRRCYADTYTNPDALDPDAVALQIASGCAWIALAEQGGSAVGTAALERANPLSAFYCRGVVDTNHRGQGILRRIGQLLVHELAPSLGFRYVHSSVVTNHPYAQLHCAELGGVSTGLLLGLYPENMRMSGIRAVSQPVSAAQVVFVCDPDPACRKLGLRGHDLRRARAILDRFEIPSARRRSGDAPTLRWRAEDRPTLGLVQIVPDSRGTVQVPLEAGCLARLLWVDVPATHPAAQDQVDTLRNQGFCHGAYLPGLGPDGGDVLRLQRLQTESDLTSDNVAMAPSFRTTRDDVFAEYAWTRVACA